MNWFSCPVSNENFIFVKFTHSFYSPIFLEFHVLIILWLVRCMLWWRHNPVHTHILCLCFLVSSSPQPHWFLIGDSGHFPPIAFTWDVQIFEFSFLATKQLISVKYHYPYPLFEIGELFYWFIFSNFHFNRP